MRAALAVFWETARDWYNGMVGLATMNFVWLVLSLTLILLPPATAGIYAVTHSIAHGTGAHFSDFWSGMRRHGWISYRWALLTVTVALVFVVCFDFYSKTRDVPGVIIQAILAATALVWLAMQFYLWPFVTEQQDNSLRLALKNALFLTLANPLFAFTLIGMSALVLTFSLLTALPIAVFATSFISLLGSRAVLERLTTYGKLPGLNHSGGPR